MSKHPPSLSAPSLPGPSAVEVVTTLGDSVVDVAFIQPVSQPVSRRALYGLCAASAVLLGIAAYAFMHGVGLAAINEEAYRVWTQVENRAHYDFRPERMSLIYDWLAFGGFFGGLLALVAGIAHMRRTAPRTSFTIGSASDVDLCIDDAPAARFDLVSTESGEAVVCAAGSIRGELRQQGRSRPLEALGALGLAHPSMNHPGGQDIAIPHDAALHLVIGAAKVGIRKAQAPRTMLGTMLTRFERRMTRFFAVSAAAHLALVALLSLIPPDAHSLSLSLGDGEGRFTRITAKAKEEAIRERADGTTGADGAGAGATGMHGDEGAAGDPASKAKGRMSIKKRAESPRLAYNDAIRMSREAGIVGAIRSQASAFTRMSTMADFSSGDGLFDMYGNVDGEEYGPGAGVFGSSYRGTGPGGGLVYSPNYTILGPTGPDSWLTRRGSPGAPRLPGPQLRGPKVDPTPSIVKGQLDRNIVRRYIRRQLHRVKYCYERQLLVEPELSGEVTAQFLVNGNGAVVSSRASGMGNEPVESCVAGVMKSIRFPRPGSVDVKYRFTFRPTS